MNRLHIVTGILLLSVVGGLTAAQTIDDPGTGVSVTDGTDEAIAVASSYGNVGLPYYAPGTALVEQFESNDTTDVFRVISASDETVDGFSDFAAEVDLGPYTQYSGSQLGEASLGAAQNVNGTDPVVLDPENHTELASAVLDGKQVIIDDGSITEGDVTTNFGSFEVGTGVNYTAGSSYDASLQTGTQNVNRIVVDRESVLPVVAQTTQITETFGQNVSLVVNDSDVTIQSDDTVFAEYGSDLADSAANETYVYDEARDLAVKSAMLVYLAQEPLPAVTDVTRSDGSVTVEVTNAGIGTATGVEVAVDLVSDPSVDDYNTTYQDGTMTVNLGDVEEGETVEFSYNAVDGEQDPRVVGTDDTAIVGGPGTATIIDGLVDPINEVEEQVNVVSVGIMIILGIGAVYWVYRRTQ